MRLSYKDFSNVLVWSEVALLEPNEEQPFARLYIVIVFVLGFLLNEQASFLRIKYGVNQLSTMSIHRYCSSHNYNHNHYNHYSTRLEVVTGTFLSLSVFLLDNFFDPHTLQLINCRSLFISTSEYL